MFQPRRLQVYNTLSHQKEDFIPLLEEGKVDVVGMYSCGPTVYYSPSIGNYRAFFTADLIRNTLVYICGYPVKAVMNMTDVGHLTSDGDTGDDKMEKGAKREGTSVWEIARKYESEFLTGLKKLHIDRFDVMPKATEHVTQQIGLIQTLEKKGYTYEVLGDGIYMDTSKVDDYGKLMGPNYKKRLEHLNAGERIEMGGKKHATDFALWKFSPKDEKRQMERDSPWGIGFPGWHIECSAMSSEYLGQQFDLHHGGADHITVHHSNEIAQSECAFEKKPWVKYWVHNEFLQVDGGKMGKSLGNAYILEDVEAKGFSPLDLRYFFFMAQYSNFQNFTREALTQAKKTRENLQKKIAKHTKTLPSSLPNTLEAAAKVSSKAKNLIDQIDEAMKDNFNTPKLLSVINNALNAPNEDVLQVLYGLEEKILKVGLFDVAFELFHSSSSQRQAEAPPEITQLANQRMQAKQEKNYALADELRKQIQEAGYVIKDTPEGFELKKQE